MANSFLEEEQNALIETAIKVLMFRANENAKSKGFWEDYEYVKQILADDESDMSVQGRVQNMLAQGWFESTAEQAALARVHSEVSEWLESVRHDGSDVCDQHLPEFKSQEIEAADILIRVFDMCEHFGYRLADAVIAKMQFNESRPRKHGKNS